MNDTKVKFSTNYLELKDALTMLTPGDLQHIEDKAKILSLEDSLIWLGLTLAEIPPTPDLEFATKAHARGALGAIHTAAQKLFNNMNTKNGAIAALEYLKHTSSTFQVSATQIPANQGGGFNFTVSLTPEETPTDTKDNQSDSGKSEIRGSDVPGAISTQPALAEVSK